MKSQISIYCLFVAFSQILTIVNGQNFCGLYCSDYWTFNSDSVLEDVRAISNAQMAYGSGDQKILSSGSLYHSSHVYTQVGYTLRTAYFSGGYHVLSGGM